MVNGCLIIQAIRDIVHQNISQDTRMALYEKMLLINEQEYLTLKNARYRVGEPEGEEDEYARDEKYPEFGDDSEFGGDYSYYSDDDDDDYGDDPRHPFRYDYQPTPRAPLAEEEVFEEELTAEDVAEVEADAQNVVEEVEHLVEELHVAQE